MGGRMGRKELEALIVVLQQQLALERDGVILGTWEIHYNREKSAFLFDKCEMGGYCEERPSVISVAGDVLDRGGPIGG
jgi:hypothetical protein